MVTTEDYFIMQILTGGPPNLCVLIMHLMTNLLVLSPATFLCVKWCTEVT